MHIILKINETKERPKMTESIFEKTLYDMVFFYFIV